MVKVYEVYLKGGPKPHKVIGLCFAESPREAIKTVRENRDIRKLPYYTYDDCAARISKAVQP